MKKKLNQAKKNWEKILWIIPEDKRKLMKNQRVKASIEEEKELERAAEKEKLRKEQKKRLALKVRPQKDF